MQQQRKGSSCELQLLMDPSQSRGIGSRPPVADHVEGRGQVSQAPPLALTDGTPLARLGTQPGVGAGSLDDSQPCVGVEGNTIGKGESPSAVVLKSGGGEAVADLDRMIKDCKDAMARKKDSTVGAEVDV